MLVSEFAVIMGMQMEGVCERKGNQNSVAVYFRRTRGFFFLQLFFAKYPTLIIYGPFLLLYL